MTFKALETDEQRRLLTRWLAKPPYKPHLLVKYIEQRTNATLLLVRLRYDRHGGAEARDCRLVLQSPRVRRGESFDAAVARVLAQANMLTCIGLYDFDVSAKDLLEDLVWACTQLENDNLEALL